MKNLIAFITLLIFLHGITNCLISTEAKISSVDDPVLDVDGDKLLAGTGYYIAPTFLIGGGITEYPIPNRLCTFAVAQLLLLGYGLPLRFQFIKSQTTNAILESTDLLVRAVHEELNIACESSWKVDDYDESTKKYFIVSGGIDADPDKELSRRLFRIEKVGSDNIYKFVYCPKVDEFSVEVCRPVGIFFHDGVRRLALVDDSNFTFRFRKTEEELLHGLELGR